MAFDTFNVFLIGLAVLLIAVAIYRADAHFKSLPPPKNSLGFSPS